MMARLSSQEFLNPPRATDDIGRLAKYAFNMNTFSFSVNPPLQEDCVTAERLPGE
jgi:hypothetical protein